jgi:hypothetical protein
MLGEIICCLIQSSKIKYVSVQGINLFSGRIAGREHERWYQEHINSILRFEREKNSSPKINPTLVNKSELIIEEREENR